MGGCSSDFYKTIKKQHGQLFQKFIVGSESLLEFKRMVKTKQQTYQSQAEQKRQSIHNEIKKRQELMLSHYEGTKNDISEKLPLGIEDYEQMKRQKLSEILGLQEYQRRFDGVHSQIDSSINERKQTVQKQYEQIARQVQQEYKIDSQKMQLIHEMPQQRRAMIRQKGVKEFAQHITKRLTDLQKKYEQQLNTQKQVKQLQSVISLQQVDHLVNMAKNKFRTQGVNVMGGYMDSEINV